jgi:hypothetical protein
LLCATLLALLAQALSTPVAAQELRTSSVDRPASSATASARSGAGNRAANFPVLLNWAKIHGVKSITIGGTSVLRPAPTPASSCRHGALTVTVDRLDYYNVLVLT